MSVLMSIVARFAGLFYAATTGAAFYKMLHARQAGLSTLQAGMIAGVAGLGLQLGLLFAPSSLRHGSRARRAAGLLMLPGLLLLLAMLIGGIQRSPREMSVVVVTAVGVLIYASQYLVLWRAGRLSKGSPKPAV